jgi:hypothetical protein
MTMRILTASRRGDQHKQANRLRSDQTPSTQDVVHTTASFTTPRRVQTTYPLSLLQISKLFEIWPTFGEANTLPQTAAERRPWPTKPACDGS